MKPRYYLFDHRIIFLIGYIYYFFTPYFVGTTNAFEGYLGIELYQGFFRLIPKAKLNSYVWITLSWLVAFYLGHLCFKMIKPYKKSLQLFPASFASKGMDYIAILLLPVLILFTWLSRDAFSGAYTLTGTDAKGKLASLLVMFNFLLLYQLLSKQKASRLLIAETVITALLLILTGGRLYSFQTIVILLMYKTSFATKRWRGYHIAGIVFMAFLLGSATGLRRIGASFTFGRAAYSFLAEPVFTWISTSTFLISNDIPLINMPLNFMTSFFNLVPNSILPLKSLIVSSHAGYAFQTPLGAESVWTNIIINFGVIGSFIFMGITGFMLNLLRHLSEDNHFWAAYYLMVCGMLPFQFFRDGFYIVNKQLFFNFLFLPLLILFILKCIQFAQSRPDKAVIGRGSGN
ncbi:MAG TPA: O-antigen polymerase [Puia sp.]|nr:O-antigen polymerase [Puia sp.]